MEELKTTKVNPFPATTCRDCGGTVILGAQQYHDCPGPRVAHA